MTSKNKIFYTAIGHFRTKRDGYGKTYPVVIVNQREYTMDLQEMIIWTMLNWRLLEHSAVVWYYNNTVRDLPLTEPRTLEDCMARLVTRGLVVSGTASNTQDALYDLLGGLYVVPISKSLPRQMISFLRLMVLKHIPYHEARKVFHSPKLSDDEAQVLDLARQALLSTAELVKCVERDVIDVSSNEKIMAALYDDTDTTCDNIADLMRNAKKREAAVMAVANLYLRKMVIFDRV